MSTTVDRPGTSDTLSTQKEGPEQRKSERLEHIHLADIRPSSLNPRTLYDEEALEDLAESIREHGILEPLVVRPICQDVAGSRVVYLHEIIAGERRYRAAQIAGLIRVPCVVRGEMSDRDALVLTLVENLHRRDLNVMEAAEGYQRLTALGYRQERIAQLVGASVPAVSNTLRLLKLPAAVRLMIAAGQLTRSHGLLLLPLVGIRNGTTQAEQEKPCIEMADWCVRHNWPVKRLETQIAADYPRATEAALLDVPPQEARIAPPGPAPASDADLDDWEKGYYAPSDVGEADVPAAANEAPPVDERGPEPLGAGGGAAKPSDAPQGEPDAAPAPARAQAVPPAPVVAAPPVAHAVPAQDVPLADAPDAGNPATDLRPESKDLRPESMRIAANLLYRALEPGGAVDRMQSGLRFHGRPSELAVVKLLIKEIAEGLFRDSRKAEEATPFAAGQAVEVERPGGWVPGTITDAQVIHGKPVVCVEVEGEVGYSPQRADQVRAIPAPLSPAGDPSPILTVTEIGNGDRVRDRLSDRFCVVTGIQDRPWGSVALVRYDDGEERDVHVSHLERIDPPAEEAEAYAPREMDFCRSCGTQPVESGVTLCPDCDPAKGVGE